MYRAQHPDSEEWGLPEQLLAAVFDVLNMANYQRGGGKGSKPKPLPRPGVGDGNRRYGKTDLPPERVKEILEGYGRGDYATEVVTDGD